MLWRLLSVPIFVKVLGIGLLVTVLFGTVAFLQIRIGMFRTHYQVHGETALAIVTSLAERIEPFLASRDVPALDAEINKTIGSFPDVRYIVVQDESGRILSHGFTFPKEAPPDLLAHKGDLCAACHAALAPTEIPADLLEAPLKLALPKGRVQAYQRPGGLVLEVSSPIGDGHAGTIRLGVGDTFIVREIASITRSLLWSLALCLAVSLSLSLALAFVLVQPIHNLVQTTDRVRREDFGARAQVFSGDEIGQLASAFNQMAEGLEHYRREVQEKDADLVSLIGKIVQAQEDERRSLARELHDQLGQSLSSTLLTVESACRDAPQIREACEKVKSEIRGIIDDVRNLAWQVRPSILDDYGLDRALARLIEETSRRVDFPIDYQCVPASETRRLPNHIEVTLYRIAQEGITNIMRHAAATQASVILLMHDREVSLIIEDNGKGFDLAAAEKGLRGGPYPGGGAPRRPSLGLIGMKERAALVGGEFTVDSQPGKGTTLRVRIALTTPEEEPKPNHGD